MPKPAKNSMATKIFDYRQDGKPATPKRNPKVAEGDTDAE